LGRGRGSRGWDEMWAGLVELAGEDWVGVVGRIFSEVSATQAPAKQTRDAVTAGRLFLLFLCPDLVS
jgi:hypothetical protein